MTFIRKSVNRRKRIKNCTVERSDIKKLVNALAIKNKDNFFKINTTPAYSKIGDELFFLN